MLFPNLTLLSRVSSVGVTYEGVVPYALARAQPVMWHHIGVSHAGSSGATDESHHLLWHDWSPSHHALRVHQSCHSRECDSVVLDRLA
jgi:hypothetical protein